MRDYAQTCVKLAKGRPMSWSFRKVATTGVEIFDTIINLLETAPCRNLVCSSWFLRAVPSCLGLVISSLLPLSENTMESLELSMYDPADSTAQWELPSEDNRLRGDLRSFSRLSRVGLFILHPFVSSDIPLPRQQLTHISINAPRVRTTEIFNLLRECRKLQSFKLIVEITDDSIQAESDDPITLPDLTELSFSSESLDLFWALGHNTLQTPILHDLILDAKTVHFEFQNSHFNDYIIRCKTSLRRLWVTGIQASEVSDLIAPHLHLLEELTIGLADDHTLDSFDALIIESTLPNDAAIRPNFPNLICLRIIGSMDIDMDMQKLFLEIVESRGWDKDSVIENGMNIRNGVAQLRRAYLHGPDAIQKSVDCFFSFPEVESLRKKGLDLVILVPTGDQRVPEFLGSGWVYAVYE